MKRIFFYMMIWAVLTPSILFAQITPEQIIKNAEYNQVHDTSKSTGKMIITNRFGTQQKTFEAVAQGEDNMLLTFTNIEERGQKILRLKDEIYLYFPDAEGLLRLQGGALKESVMGSSFSYEDLTGEKGLLDLYTVSFIETTPVQIEISGTSYSCYHLKLKGKRSVAYPEQELWIDSSNFVVRRAVYKSLSGRALKELVVERVERISGKYVPVQFNMIDKLQKNSQTRFIIENLRINVALRPDEFSLERLSF
ncbi:MAG: outer membrane lipoprotein-sorting protein [Spirochaetales bacterium]|nr:outer membrane lipoprotein-sorting protein [Spirochaetales bacterium]